MKKLAMLLVCTVGGLTGCAASTKTANDYASEGLRHAEAYPGLASLCDLTQPLRIAGRRDPGATAAKRKTDSPDRKRSAPIPAVRVFDNLYYVGTGGVASWVIDTRAGLIVIDALNNNDQARQYIENGLLSLGLDPADMRYLIITHEHGDHYGGQDYLVKTFHPKVVMSEPAWQALESPRQEFSSPRWGEKPQRDVAIGEEGEIRLGDTVVRLWQTPGHTPGTLSLIFPVYDNGVKHVAALWGGTGLNYGPDYDRIMSYSISAGRFRQQAELADVDVFLSNHPTRDGTRDKIPKLAHRKAGEPHPFVVGEQTALRAFDLLENCTRAQAEKVQGNL